jgi:hypothetical protein
MFSPHQCGAKTHVTTLSAQHHAVFIRTPFQGYD